MGAGGGPDPSRCREAVGPDEAFAPFAPEAAASGRKKRYAYADSKIASRQKMVERWRDQLPQHHAIRQRHLPLERELALATDQRPSFAKRAASRSAPADESLLPDGRVCEILGHKPRAQLRHELRRQRREASSGGGKVKAGQLRSSLPNPAFLTSSHAEGCRHQVLIPMVP